MGVQACHLSVWQIIIRKWGDSTAVNSAMWLFQSSHAADSETSPAIAGNFRFATDYIVLTQRAWRAKSFLTEVSTNGAAKANLLLLHGESQVSGCCPGFPSRKANLEPRGTTRSPKRALEARAYSHWSGQRDLNARPPAPKAGDLPKCPSIESGIYGTCLLEVVGMTSYNSRYIAPLHSLRLDLPEAK